MAPNPVSSYCSSNYLLTWQTLFELDISIVSESSTLAIDRAVKIVEGRNLPVANLAQFRSSLIRAIGSAVDWYQKSDPDELLYLRGLLQETDQADWEPPRCENESIRQPRDERRTHPKSRGSSQCWGYFFVEKDELGMDGMKRRVLEFYLYS